MGYPTVSNYIRSYVRARAEAHMNCTILITRGTRPAYLDPTTNTVTAHGKSTVYKGKARIWSVAANTPTGIGETDLILNSATISVPWSINPRNDDTIFVMACPGDPDLVGRGFRITGNDGGALMRATRNLSVVTVGENRSWGL